MPEEEWEGLLSPQDRLRVHFITRKGKVIDIVLVQYEAQIKGKWIPLVRFDRAHGYFHRDIMRPDGTQEKTRWPFEDLGQALTEAIEEIKRQWLFYRQTYEREMKK